MFPSRYFADRYFAPRYWPKVGAAESTTDAPGIWWRARDPGVVWRADGEHAMHFAELEHLAGWSRVYVADFGRFAEIVAGQTLDAVSGWSWPSGITAGSPAISGDTVQIRLSGATRPATLTATCTVTTSGGDTLSQKTPLKVVT